MRATTFYPLIGLGLLIFVIFAITPLYLRVCQAPLDGFYVLADAREQARAAASREAQPSAARAPSSASTSAPAELSSLLSEVGKTVRASTLWAKIQALDLLIRVKQSDWVAYPLHLVAGYSLELNRCPATGDQWRKASAHAWADGPAELAAAGLRRSLAPSLGERGVVELLDRYATAEPWFADNLARVRQRYLR